MTRVICGFTIFALLTIDILAFGAERGDFTGNVPREVNQLMREKRCAPIKDFYARVVASPPFLYISRLFDGDTAIVFACEIINPTSDDRYKIVFVRKSYTGTGAVYSDYEKCVSEIYFRSMPGGLSVRLNQESLPQDHNLWANTRNYVSRDSNLDLSLDQSPHWLLDERAASVGYGLFCANGEWYNVAYD